MALKDVIADVADVVEVIDNGGSNPNFIPFNDYLEIFLREAVNVVDYDTGDIVYAWRNEANLEAELNVGDAMGFLSVDFFEKVI